MTLVYSRIQCNTVECERVGLLFSEVQYNAVGYCEIHTILQDNTTSFHTVPPLLSAHYVTQHVLAVAMHYGHFVFNYYFLVRILVPESFT